MSIKLSFSRPLLATAILFSAGAALADPPPIASGDPPAIAGRLSYAEGTVSFHAADQNEWSQATVNYPVTSGDAFWTEPGAKSEVQVGGAEIRMDQSTEMDVTELDDKATAIDVSQGVVNVHIHEVPPSGSIEINTPTGTAELTQPGTYHIDAGHPIGDQPSGTLLATTLEGQMELRGPQSSVDVPAGEMAILSGNPPAFNLQEANATPLDDWALMREKREVASQAPRYVSPQMTGYEDLNTNGQWATESDYGPVWYPTTVVADWAPYRYGHWAFVAPWGWTWVDEAPWGFAPFHYGRWAYIHDRWGWCPGEVVERPVYAPALVAFVGGGGWGVSIGIGGPVGWVPLGPHEVFHPYYRTSLGYARDINRGHVDRTVINNITINNYRTVNTTALANRHAATVVSSDTFTHGQAVHRGMVSVSQSQLEHAPAMTSVSHLQPAAEARAGGRTLSPAARSEIPQRVQNDAARESTVPAHNRMEEAPHTISNVSHGAQAAPENTRTAPVQNARPEEERAAQTEHEAAHVPGPQIRSHVTSVTSRTSAISIQRQQLPHAEVQHPAQQTRITPTPQGWQRTQPQAVPQAQHEQSHGGGGASESRGGNESHGGGDSRGSGGSEDRRGQ